MNTTSAPESLSRYGLIAAIGLGVIGAMIIWITPGFVALVAQQAHLDDQQVGYVAAWDINASAVAIAISTLLLRRVHWRILAGVSLLLIVAGNLSCAAVHSYSSIIAVRVLAGTGEGLAIGVAFAALGQAMNPDRAFAIYLCVGGAICAGILLVLPVIQSHVGPAPVFIGIAVLAGIVSLGLPWFPGRGRSSGGQFGGRSRINLRLAASALTAVFLYFLAQGALWSYFERIGLANSISGTQIGNATAVSTVAGIGGALLAAILPSRLGRAWPLAISGCVSVVSFLLLLGHVTPLALVIAGVLLTFAWNYSQPLFSGLCCEADADGRIVCAMGSIQTVGYGLGPAVAAMLLVDRNFAPIVWMSTAVLLTSLMIMLTGMRGHTRVALPVAA